KAAPAAGGTADDETDLDNLGETVLDHPLFSPSREGPAAPAEAPTQAPIAQDFHAVLTGMLIGPDTRTAFFSPPGEATLTTRIGDELNGWKIKEIEPDFVIVVGPGGEKRLEPTPVAAATGGTGPKPVKKRPKRPAPNVAAPQPIP